MELTISLARSGSKNAARELRAFVPELTSQLAAPLAEGDQDDDETDSEKNHFAAEVPQKSR